MLITTLGGQSSTSLPNGVFLLPYCTLLDAIPCVLQEHLPSQHLVIFVINDSGNHWTLLVSYSIVFEFGWPTTRLYMQ